MGIQTVLMSSSYTETFKRQIPLICGEERKLVHKNEYATRFRHWYVACIRPNKKEAMFELLSREMKFKQAIVWTSSTRAEKVNLKRSFCFLFLFSLMAKVVKFDPIYF